MQRGNTDMYLSYRWPKDSIMHAGVDAIDVRPFEQSVFSVYNRRQIDRKIYNDALVLQRLIPERRRPHYPNYLHLYL